MNKKRKCIVQINAVFEKGSTGSIVADIHNILKNKGYDSYVFIPYDGQEYNDNIEIKRIGNRADHLSHAILWRVFQNQGWNSYLSTIKLCRQLKKLHPDIVHLHNLHSNYIHLGILLKFLAKEKTTVVVTMHDCWFFTGNCFHFMKYNNCQNWKLNCSNCPRYKKKIYKFITQRLWNRKRNLFRKINKLAVLGVSEWIIECAKEATAFDKVKYFHTIYNWIDCDIFKPIESKNRVREKYKLDKKRMVLGVSQGWSNEKGLLEFKLISEKFFDDVIVVLVGNSCGHLDTKNMKFIGYTKDMSELADLYSAADVFVNPSRMETFGKVTAEALASGTPVVCYANTGTVELVNDKVGECVEDGNIDRLLMATEKILKIGKENYTTQCRLRALQYFEKNRQLLKHIDFYEHLMEE